MILRQGAGWVSPESMKLKNGYWYLASPYSKYPDGLEKAFLDAARAAGWFNNRGISVYSPIVHTHPIAKVAGIDPVDQEFWLEVDRPMMNAAHGLIVLQLEGWEESSGIAYEIEVFQDTEQEIIYAEPK